MSAEFFNLDSIPTWVTFLLLLPKAKNTKSPFLDFLSETFFPRSICCEVVLGIFKPIDSKDLTSNPEQSIPLLSFPPHLYGVPIYVLASSITLSIFLLVDNFFCDIQPENRIAEKKKKIIFS